MDCGSWTKFEKGKQLPPDFTSHPSPGGDLKPESRNCTYIRPWTSTNINHNIPKRSMYGICLHWGGARGVNGGRTSTPRHLASTNCGGVKKFLPAPVLHPQVFKPSCHCLSSNLLAMASNLIAMAYNLLAMTSNLEVTHPKHLQTRDSNTSEDSLLRRLSRNCSVKGVCVGLLVGCLKTTWNLSDPYFLAKTFFPLKTKDHA